MIYDADLRGAEILEAEVGREGLLHGRVCVRCYGTPENRLFLQTQCCEDFIACKTFKIEFSVFCHHCRSL